MTLHKDVKIFCPHCRFWNPGGIAGLPTPSQFACFRCGKNVTAAKYPVAASSDARGVSAAKPRQGQIAGVNISAPRPSGTVWPGVIIAALLVGLAALGIFLRANAPQQAGSPAAHAGLGSQANVDLSKWTEGALCDVALLPRSRLDWDTAPEYARHVREARNRSLTVTRCREILKLPRLTVENNLSAKALEAWSDKALCSAALNGPKSGWDTRPEYEKYLLQIRVRNLTVSACQAITGVKGK